MNGNMILHYLSAVKYSVTRKNVLKQLGLYSELVFILINFSNGTFRHNDGSLFWGIISL